MKSLEALQFLLSKAPSVDHDLVRQVLQMFVCCSWPVRVQAVRLLLTVSTVAADVHSMVMDFIIDQLSGGARSDQLPKFKARAVYLLSNLAASCPDESRRNYAISLLKRFMDDDKFDVRTEAIQGVVQCLQRFPDEFSELHGQLIDQLVADDNSFVKQTIVSQLPHLGTICKEWRQEVVDILIASIVQHEKDLDLACECMDCLAYFEESSQDSVLDIVFDILAQSEVHINLRNKASRTIANIAARFVPSRIPGFVDRLIPLLKPDHENCHRYFENDSSRRDSMGSFKMPLFTQDKSHSPDGHSSSMQPFASSMGFSHATLGDNEIIFNAIHAMITEHKLVLTQAQVAALYQCQCLEAEFLILSIRTA